MGVYDGMLPKEYDKGKIGYYPVMNKEEWDNLPVLYKAMEWSAIPDPLDKERRLRAVKSVTFDVIHMEPYGIRAEVTVHPQEVQKLLFCNYGKTQCHLYSVSKVELEGGTKLPAQWLQDTTTGAFAIALTPRNKIVGRQGGFHGHIPECIEKLEDGTFKWKGFGNYSKTNHYEFSNPYRDIKQEKNVEKDAVEKPMDAVAEYGLENSWSDNDIIDTLVGCGVTKDDFIKYGKEDFLKDYFEDSLEAVTGYRCKCCGTMIEEDIDDPEWFDLAGEEDLWGHIQRCHEEIFEECQDWETPTMLEVYYERVDGRVKEGYGKDAIKKAEVIGNAIEAAINDGYEQFVVKDGNGDYSFARAAGGKPVTPMFEGERIVGKVVLENLPGCGGARYEELKSIKTLAEKMAEAKESVKGVSGESKVCEKVVERD